VQRSKLIAVAFYFGAVMIGAAVGIAVDRMVVREWLDRRARDPRAMHDRFASYLHLTAEQRASFDSILSAARRTDSTLMAPARALVTTLKPQQDSIRTARDSKIRALLTADQQKLFDERQAPRPRPASPRR
jgi:Spy/CpxP family protein refolding chaperone